ELEVVRGLRRPGVISLDGRDSAGARRSERTTPAFLTGHYTGGARGVYAPKLVKGWLEGRTPR
ncbi:MAG: hypothetical protein AAFY88_20035, partial [Acidobacteriota bacterium]